jgi:hypothetical protein
MLPAFATYSFLIFFSSYTLASLSNLTSLEATIYQASSKESSLWKEGSSGSFCCFFASSGIIELRDVIFELKAILFVLFFIFLFCVLVMYFLNYASLYINI